MEYALWAFGIFIALGLVAVILYGAWLIRYGIEAYRVGAISVRRSIGVSLEPYSREVRCVLAACKGNAFMRRELDAARPILKQTCIVMTENLYINNIKCIGLAQRVQFMNLPGDAMRRYIIFLDMASIRSKALNYESIESLVRHEFEHHYKSYINEKHLRS